MTERERGALGNPETGVFVIGFREEQRTTHDWFILFRAKMKSLLNALLRPMTNIRGRKSFGY